MQQCGFKKCRLGQSKALSLSLLGLILSCFASLAVAGQPAGMAMDIQGQAEQSVAGIQAPIKLLDYVQSGSSVQLNDKSVLSLTVYAEKKLYKFQGPAVFEVTETGQVKLVSGAEPVVRPLGERVLKSSAAQGNFIPGSTRMRSAMAPVLLLTPANGSVLTDSAVSFMWATAQQGPYLFKLIGPTGEALWEKSISEKQIQLPAEVKLAQGTPYKWQVALEKGHGKSERAQFTLANAGQIKAVRESAPAASAPIEEQVMYAIELRDTGYIQEADKVVKAIRQTRPDLAEAILSSDPN